MAEVRASIALSVTSGSDQIKGTKVASYTAVSSSYFTNIQSFSGSYTPIDMDGISNIRYFYLCNLSTSSIFLSQHPDSSSFAVLRDGDPIIIPPSSSVVTYYAKSSVGTGSLKVIGTGY